MNQWVILLILFMLAAAVGNSFESRTDCREVCEVREW